MGPFSVCWGPPLSYLTSSPWVLAEPGPTSSAYLEPDASYLWCQGPLNIPQGPHLNSCLDLSSQLFQPEALLFFPKPWSLSEPKAQVRKQPLLSSGPGHPRAPARASLCEILALVRFRVLRSSLGLLPGCPAAPETSPLPHMGSRPREAQG